MLPSVVEPVDVGERGPLDVLGLAAELATSDHAQRKVACDTYRTAVLAALEPLGFQLNGDPSRTIVSTLNLSLPGLDSEAVMLALKGLVAISNGSACTSQKYEPSHVLEAMNLTEDAVRGALRLSWSHLTPPADWSEVSQRVRALK